MKKAGLVREQEYRFSFISESEVYTIFIPSKDALAAYDFDTMTTEELRNQLLIHFVQGEIIFTDGNKPSRYYETTRIDEKSTQFSSVYTQIYLETGIDLIRIRAADGSVLSEITESARANQLTGVVVRSEDDQVFSNIFNNAVIHELNRVLVFDEVDTN